MNKFFFGGGGGGKLGPNLGFFSFSQDCSLGQCLTSSRAEPPQNNNNNNNNDNNNDNNNNNGSNWSRNDLF